MKHTTANLFLILTLLLWTGLRSHAEEAPASHSDIDVVLLGDSNIWIGGDNCDKPQGWNCWWREFFAPRSCRSYARSGATWTNTAATKRNLTQDIAVLGPDNVIYNQVCRLIDAADSGNQVEPGLIIIGAGTNDAWFWRKRPGIFSDSPAQINAATVTALRPSQATSLARAVMLSCQMLRKRFPKAKIVLLTPLPTTAATPSNQQKVSETIAHCGQIMDMPVIRLDVESGIDADEEKQSPRLTTDGTHTSIDGARQVARLLDRRISQILSPAAI